MLQVINLKKSYGDRLLFKDVTFSIASRERMGLVGRNGLGKTTLFRLITEEETPDEGTIMVPKDYAVGTVSQKLHFTQQTVIREAAGKDRYNENEWIARKTLYGLGFTEEDVQKAPSELSGGYQIRLNLAKVLISQPNLLLLDEPTNYLDIVSLRWLERLLISWPGEFILITHDRSFMDRVTNTTMGIHRQKVRKVQGSTEKLYDQLAEEEEIYEKTRLNEEKKRKKVEVFISRFRAKARLGNLVQSRIKMLEKQERKEKLSQLKTLEFSFNQEPITADTIMKVKGLTFSYNPEESELIRDFNITIGPKDRIGIIGKNGKGKTTLLQLLSGEKAPLSGEIKEHSRLKKGVFVQTNRVLFNEENTVEEEILSVHPDHNRQHSRDICGAMLFEGDQALKAVRVLSGGERSRVLLGKILVSPTNMLILDEPTNHFDMESNDALLAALDNFDGAVLLVTHNEMFLHALADRLIVFQENGISVFENSYQQFLETVGWDDEEDDVNSTERTGSSLNKKELRKIRSEIIVRKSRELKPIEEKIKILENKIGEYEDKERVNNELLIEASQQGQGTEIARYSQEIHRLTTALEEMYNELESLMSRQEEIQEYFDKELAPYID